MNILETLGKSLRPEKQVLKTKAERVDFTYKVIESLKEDELIPDKVARLLADDYKNDIEWSRMFGRGANQCAARIVAKFKKGENPIKLSLEE